MCVLLPDWPLKSISLVAIDEVKVTEFGSSKNVFWCSPYIYTSSNWQFIPFYELLTKPFFGPKIGVLLLRISIEIIYNMNTEWQNGNSAQQNQGFCFMNTNFVHGSESWFFFWATENFVTQISQSWYAGKYSSATCYVGHHQLCPLLTFWIRVS